jgi:hypothetical protein
MDFAILAEAVWNQFVFRYDGGPPIPVPFHPNRVRRAIVAWRKFPVILLYRDTDKRYFADQFSRIGYIHEAAIDLFGITNSE